jgi:hypothetical protein
MRTSIRCFQAIVEGRCVLADLDNPMASST